MAAALAAQLVMGSAGPSEWGWGAPLDLQAEAQMVLGWAAMKVRAPAIATAPGVAVSKVQELVLSSEQVSVSSSERKWAAS